MNAKAETVTPPGLTRRPKVGLVLSYVGHYHSVKVLHRFLQLAGFEVVTSRRSTSPIIDTGTAMTSADFCLPLRVYVGHVFHLTQKHPDLDAILAPNVWTDHAGSATCSKYRDVGGTAIRSLVGMVSYMEGKGSHPLPRVIRPDVQSPDRTTLRNVAYDVYAEILGLPPRTRLGFLLPRGLRRRWAPHVEHVESAFEQAWHETAAHPGTDWRRKLADETKPRLALVGRRYLIDDPALSADMRPWFTRAGAVVLTAADVPWAELEPYYRAVRGYYDTHKEGQAFIDWAADKVDGFISLGAFGCHPDAFQVDFLAEYARSKGKPAWTFRFDETSGNAGFQTRFETIYGFLEAERDKRLARAEIARAHHETAATREPWTCQTAHGKSAPGESAPGEPATGGQARTEPVPEGPLPGGPVPGGSVPGGLAPGDPLLGGSALGAPATGGLAPRERRPLFVWPYMGEELNLLIEEILFQLGLQEYAFPPRPIDGSTLEIGSRHYAETCSPFACATGSLMQSVQRAVRELREEAAREGRQVEPRRIFALMLQGEGPCTFGWYAIAQNHHLAADLAPDLQDGHTVELLTMGLKDPTEILQDLARLGDTRRWAPLLEFAEARLSGQWERMSRWQRLRLQVRFLLALRARLAPVFAKLDAAEAVRARSLLVRAHERKQGSTTRAYHECLDWLREAHTPRSIRRTLRRCLAHLAALPQDRSPKPRVAAVGEIYVLLTSFANRGVIEKLLGEEGIEVVEGISLSQFIRRSWRETRRRMLVSHPLVKPFVTWLAERGIEWFRQRPDEHKARPLLDVEVGGEGMPGVAAARDLVERGCDGVVHVYPFKCMPEGVAKDAYKEMSDLYQVRYLGLSFDKETEIERVRTEISTFAALLHAQMAGRGDWLSRLRLLWQRRALGRRLDALYRRNKMGARRAAAPS